MLLPPRALPPLVLLLALGAAVSAGTGCDPERELAVAFEDPRMGRVEVHGLLHPARGARRLLVLVPGLGDDHHAPAVKGAAEAARGRGWATLRISLRGADKSGQGLPFAGDVEDLHQVVRHGALAPYDTIALFGFSHGGHDVLRYAAHKPDARVKAVVAVSAPLDLVRAMPVLDASPAAPSVLAALSAQYAPFHDEMMRRGKLQWLPRPDRVARMKTLRAFDDEVTAPMIGHKDAAAYYAAESVAPRLKDIAIPAAIIAGTGDPVVPVEHVRDATQGLPATSPVAVFEVDGGHITMSPSMTMGQRAPDGLVPQALAWIEAHVL